MAAPPVLEGGNQLRITEVFPWLPDTPVGAPGAVEGVTAADAAESAESPLAFVATTLKV
jgi:hypothetical protein